MLRKFSAVAAVIALMLCSGVVGAAAFGAKPPETVALEEIGLTLILPDEWRGKYGVEVNEDGTGCALYAKSVHESDGDWAGSGYLFWIGKAASDQQPLTPEELYAWSPTPCVYLFSTADATYMLEKPSDVQYDPYDPEQKALYMEMSRQIQEISFQIENPATID